MTDKMSKAEQLAVLRKIDDRRWCGICSVDKCEFPHEADCQFARLILCIEAEAAQEAAPVPDAWVPIESAPKDGTHILIAFGEDHVSVGVYSLNDDDPFPWKFIDEQGTRLPIFNGAVDHHRLGPTHWRPLPPPPTREAKR